ncbi:outer membrane beta-barrel protein [Endozoicomonas sp. Mp262]|uniref:outer membrane beta-barrel protein n=1 Tax=Endozoicomonas sp. Mp262 TaxID=2919499 RepID=UPI0021D990C7
MKIISKLSFAVYAVLYSSWSIATVEDPGSFEMGGINVTPLLKAGVGYDDNVYREGTEGNDLKEKSATVYTVAPSIELKAEQGMSYYALTVDGVHKSFSGESDHDFTDYGAALDIHHEFNSRHRLTVTSGYGIKHDQGSTVDEAKDKSAPQYQQTDAAVNYGFGAKEATARVDVFGDYNAKDYEKIGKLGRDSGEDRKNKGYGATFFYKVMPKTEVLVEAKKRELSYDNQDNAGYDITSYLVGLNWEATAKSTGYIKAAHRERKSDVKTVDKENYSGWEIGISYLPVEYSLIQISSGRDYGLESENPASASFTKGFNAVVNWQHDWTSKITSNLGFSYTDDDVQNAASVVQKERKVKTFNAGLSWKVMRNLTVSLDWENTKRDEKAKVNTADEDDYTRNAYMLSAELAL